MKICFNSEKQQHEKRDQGIEVLYAPAKRGAFKLRWYFILFISFTPIALFSIYLWKDFYYRTAPAILTSEPTSIVAIKDSWVVDVFIKPGMSLKKEQHLMNLVAPELSAEFAEYRRQLKAFDEKDDIDYSKVLTLMKEDIDLRRENVGDLKKILDKYTSLYHENLVSPADYGKAILLHAQAKSSFLNTELALEHFLLKIKDDELIGSHTVFKNELLRDMAVLESLSNNLQPKASIDAEVIEVSVKAGDWVHKGDRLAVIKYNQTMQLHAYVLPKYLNEVKQGSVVTVQFPSGEKFKATVTNLVVVADKIPVQLSTPYKGIKNVLKVKMTFESKLPKRLQIEGLRLEVIFND